MTGFSDQQVLNALMRNIYQGRGHQIEAAKSAVEDALAAGEATFSRIEIISNWVHASMILRFAEEFDAYLLTRVPGWSPCLSCAERRAYRNARGWR